MSDKSKIEWTDATWNPITGCSVVSPGCTNCYAMRLAGTRLKHHPSRKGLTDMTNAGPVWNGQVRLNEDWLDQPLKWKKPRKIFVCAHGDLFHGNVLDVWIDEVFAVMALCPQHVFQVLTKRPDRMRGYIKTIRSLFWTLPNVWLGVSVEDQRRADERIPDLLATPAAVRFVSAEPLLGPVDLIDLTVDRPDGIHQIDALHCDTPLEDCGEFGDATLDWVICGGESGQNARPMHPDWARSLRDQCSHAGVPFFMKQMAKLARIPDDLMVRQWPVEVV